MGRMVREAGRAIVGAAATPARAALAFSLLAWLWIVTSSLLAQGILTVTPGRTVATVAGTGVVGYTGNGSLGSTATLANPGAVAYDAIGNLYVADAQNHVVRKISIAGIITTIAGTGVEGYGGDGGAATAAFLDTPTGVAVDTRGNIYIADSHNHRIRQVSGGKITTIAGVGTPGFSGDGRSATAAQFWLPTAVAVDAKGNIYIADTNNQRIRKISNGFITTIAGDGEESFAGDRAAASLAVLDSPTGVAVDGAGNVYIADRHNQRVRMVGGNGVITTVAGSGAASFSGSFSGDGSLATIATLAKPSGVGVDAEGNVYVADTGNQRIRQVGGGTIDTIIGSGLQGFGGDGSLPVSVNLSSPRAVASDVFGNLAVADRLNQRVRAATLPVLTFASDNVGILSQVQGVTLANTGTASISVATISFNGDFAIAQGGSCSSLPIRLDTGASCTQNIAFLPAAVGISSGAVVFSGAGIVPQSILLAGVGVQTSTTVTLTSSIASSFVGQPITLTVIVNPAGAGVPTGTVSFYDGTTPIGGAQTLVAGVASVTTAALLAGVHNITAIYSGDANFASNSSTVLTQLVLDFGITLATGSTPGSASSSQTVAPGEPVTFSFNIQPIGPALNNIPVVLSATELPPGATVSFAPQIITLGATSVNFTMTIQTQASTALLLRKELYGSGSGGTLALGLLLLPFSRRVRRKFSRRVSGCVAMIASLTIISAFTGCGTGSGFFAQSPQSYTIQVIGTVTGSVTLSRFATVTLVVE